MLLLGLDVSTSCTGYSVFRLEKQSSVLLEADFIELSKIKSHFKKAEVVNSVLKNIFKKYEITEAVIEENLQSIYTKS